MLPLFYTILKSIFLFFQHEYFKTCDYWISICVCFCSQTFVTAMELKWYFKMLLLQTYFIWNLSVKYCLFLSLIVILTGKPYSLCSCLIFDLHTMIIRVSKQGEMLYRLIERFLKAFCWRNIVCVLFKILKCTTAYKIFCLRGKMLFSTSIKNLNIRNVIWK